LASQHGIKVMLDGQGADELLAGYHSYLGAHFAQSLARGRVFEVIRNAMKAVSGSGISPKLLALATGAHVVPVGLHRFARRLAGEPVVPPWLGSGWVDTNVSSIVQTRTGVSNPCRAVREDMLHQLT